LRVISVSAVVIGHAWGGMPGDQYLQIWRMPLFFFLAGFFFSTSRSFTGELRARGRGLVLPYVVWLLLLSLAVLAMAQTAFPFEDGTLTGALIGGARTDMPFLAFWFISVLFFAALLLRVVLTLPWWVGVLIGLGGLTLAQLPDSAMSYTPLGIGLAPACMAFMLAGHWFGRFMRTPRGHNLPAKPWIGLLFVAVGFGGVAAGAESMNIKWSGFGTFLLSPALAILISIGLVLVFSTAVNTLLGGAAPGVHPGTRSSAHEGSQRTAPRWGRGVGVVISELVRTATLVVFLHGIVLYVLLRFFELENPVLRTVVTLLICWAVGIAINRTPLALPLSGVSRSPARQPRQTQADGKIASKT